MGGGNKHSGQYITNILSEVTSHNVEDIKGRYHKDNPLNSVDIILRSLYIKIMKKVFNSCLQIQ